MTTVIHFPGMTNPNQSQAEARWQGRLRKRCFVGREQELAELRAGLEDILEGHGRVFLLAGEPGVGKTRIARELAAYARRCGAQVSIGHCDESDSAQPYWPWVQLVRAYIADRDSQILQAEMGPGAADIAQVIPAVHERVPGLPLPPVLEPQSARFRFFESLTAFLKKAAKAQPLVLVLDDLQWADASSLLLLQWMARELRDVPLLFLGTYQDSQVGRYPPLRQTLDELTRRPGNQSLRLRGLAAGEVARLIELTVGLTPSAALVAAVSAKTQGNPFFVTEIVWLLAREGWLKWSEGSTVQRLALLPQARAVIGRRLNHLSVDCRQILSVAAVVGRKFRLPVLKMVGASFNPALTDGVVLALLEEAMAARLVAAVPHEAGCYRFTHVLIRETLYEELPVDRRVCLHRQICEVLEKISGDNLNLHFAERVYHSRQALSEGNADKAIDYARYAGERAIAQLAYEEAANHYRRALEVLEFARPEDSEQRCELLLALGDAQGRAGEHVRARGTFRQAAGSARVRKAPEALARAALGFARTYAWGEFGTVDWSGVRLLEEALDLQSKEDSALRAMLLSRLAGALSCLDVAECRPLLSAQAVQMARRVGDAMTLAHVLSDRHVMLWGPTHVEERLAIATEIMQLAQTSGQKELALRGSLYRVCGFLERGDIETMDREIASYANLVNELRQPFDLWNVAILRAMRAGLEGRLEECERLVAQALATGQRVDERNAAHLFGIQLFMVRNLQGRYEELEPTVRSFVEQYPAVPIWRCGLAYIWSELGRVLAGQEEFENLIETDFAHMPRNLNWLMSLTLLTQVCAVLRDQRRAATLYQCFLPYAGYNVVIGPGAVCYGSASRCLGLLATTLSQFEEAARHFEAALAMNARMGAKPWEAHTRYDYACMLLARRQPGDRERAGALLDLANVTAQELGMQGLGRKIAALGEEYRKTP